MFGTDAFRTPTDLRSSEKYHRWRDGCNVIITLEDLLQLKINEDSDQSSDEVH